MLRILCAAATLLILAALPVAAHEWHGNGGWHGRGYYGGGYYRGGRGAGWVAPAIIGGAILGGALAAPYYGGYGYGYGYPSQGYYPPAYVPQQSWHWVPNAYGQYSWQWY